MKISHYSTKFARRHELQLSHCTTSNGGITKFCAMYIFEPFDIVNTDSKPKISRASQNSSTAIFQNWTKCSTAIRLFGVDQRMQLECPAYPVIMKTNDGNVVNEARSHWFCLNQSFTVTVINTRMVAWLSGSALVSINEVTLRWARLVLG